MNFSDWSQRIEAQRLLQCHHFQVVNLAPMIAETIARLNRDQSLEQLLAHA